MSELIARARRYTQQLSPHIAEREAAHLISDLTSALEAAERNAADADTVPRSRYDACNADWLREKDRADMLLANGREAIETLRMEKAEAERQRDEAWSLHEDERTWRRNAEAERDEAIAALRELVRLKDLHDMNEREDKTLAGALVTQYGTLGKWLDASEQREEEYKRCKPLAWESARRLLNQKEGT